MRSPKQLCANCHRRPRVPNRTRCKPCLHLLCESARRLRVKRAAAGVCRSCATPVRAPVYCDGCAARRQELKAARRIDGQREPHVVEQLAGLTRERQLGEVLAALVLLRRGRWTVAELAGELGQHLRTAYRMLSAIRRAGIEVEVSREGVNRYHSIPEEPLRKILRLR